MTDFKRGDRVLVSAGALTDLVSDDRLIPSTTGTVELSYSSVGLIRVTLDGEETRYYRPERLTLLDVPVLPDAWSPRVDGKVWFACDGSYPLAVVLSRGDIERIIEEGPTVLRVMR